MLDPIRRFVFLFGLAFALTAAQAQVPADPYSYSRTSTFVYYSTSQPTKAGLLVYEVIEGPTGAPANAALCVSTQYTYDDYGNKSRATTSACSGATGGALFAVRSSTSTYAALPTQSITVGGTATTVAVPAGLFATGATNALGQTESREYDPRFGAVTKLIGPNGADLATRWEVDDFGRKSRELRADGTSTVYFYCYLSGFGRSLASNSAGCLTPAGTEIPADAAMFVQSEPRNTAGAKMGAASRVYSDRLGRTIRSVTESFDGALQPSGYRLAAIARDSVYNAYGAKVIETQPYFLGSTSSTTTGASDLGAALTTYDVLGRPVTIDVADISGSQTNVSFGAYGSRRAARQSVAYNALKTTTTNDKGQTRVEEKDAIGQVVRTTDASGAQLARQFDAFGNLVASRDALQNTITLSYDVRGNKLAMSDPDAGVWGYCYDALGQLKAQQNSTMRAGNTPGACPATAPGSTATVVAGWTTMAYDLLGRLTQRAEPEYTSSWDYDTNADASLCMAGTAPTRGTGKLCQIRNSNGLGRKMAYDSLGRLASTRTNVNNGPSFASAVTYEAASGRVASQIYPTGLQVGYRYTAVGGYLEKLTLLTAASVTPLPVSPGGAAGATVNLPAYDAASGNGTVLWQVQAVNAWGKAERQSHGNGVVTRASFEPDNGRTLGLVAGLGSTTNVIDQAYAWDSLDNLTGRNDNDADGGGAVTEVFSYGDQLNRLTAYTVSGPGVPSLSRSVALQYNALGLLLYKTDVGNYSYPAQGSGAARPHALQGIGGGVVRSFAYDANGNLLTASSGQYRSIAYTSFNLPDSQAGVAGSNGSPQYLWQYDERHARFREQRTIASGASAGVRTTWNLHPDNQGGLAFEREVNAPTVTTAANPPAQSNRHYLSAGGQTVGVLVSMGALPTLADSQTAPTALGSIALVKVEYWHKDHLGSLAATTDHQGTLTARYSYDPFGKRRYADGRYDSSGAIVSDWSPATSGGTDRGFTGHDHLDDVGLVHMNGRIFDPTIALFLQTDPQLQDPLNLQNYNRYGYCFNNPLTCTDPSGNSFFSKIFKFAVVAAVGYFVPIAAGSIFTSIAGTTGTLFATAASGGSLVFAIPSSLTAVGSLTSVAIGGFAAGTIASGNFKGGVQGAFTAGAFNLAGDFLNGSGAFSGGDYYGESGAVGIATHAVVGCVTSVTGGSKCGPGALSAAFSQAASRYKTDIVSGTIVSAVVGGTGSVLGGGKFTNGAETAAFGYLFNECLHTRMCGSDSTKIEIQGNVAAGSLGTLTDPTSIHLSISISDGYAGITTLDGQPRPGLICTLCLNGEVTLGPKSNIVWGPYDLATPAGLTTTSFANSLVYRANLYWDFSLGYSIPSIPSGNLGPWRYNSNSWAAGLLQKTMGSVPSLNFAPYQAPGYANPVPNFLFGR